MHNLRLTRLLAALVGITLTVALLPPVSTASAASYAVPPVFISSISLPDTTFVPPETLCLARSEFISPTQSDVAVLCYTDFTTSAPPPPPYEPPDYLPFRANLDLTTGQLTGTLWPCQAIVPDLLAFQVDIAVQLDKAGGPATGTVTVTEDWTAPFDCADGEQVVGSLTLTPLAQSHDDDIWGPNPGETGPDGCSDWEELGDTAGAGGLRDPFNFWDFFDVPIGTPPERDGAVLIGDIGGVVARFGSAGDPTSDPLTTPPAAPAYHTAFDRGASLGPDLWNVGPPDGSITTTDLGAVVAQFGHSCTAAP